MKKNMGNADKVIRIIIALLIMVLYATKTVSGLPAYLLLALGGIFILTSVIGFCPIYTLLKINTCSKKKD